MSSFRTTALPRLTLVHAIPGSSLITPKTGESQSHRISTAADESFPSRRPHPVLHVMLTESPAPRAAPNPPRIPANCAHTPMVAPSCLISPPRITPNSPRPHKLLNSGLVVLKPSQKLYNKIERYLLTSPLVATFSFPDQDLLAAFFAGSWRPLPYIYNALKPLRNIHKRMWRDEDVKCVHYILDKPWNARVGPGGKGEKSDFAVTHSWWWEQYVVLEKIMNSDGPYGDRDAWRFIDQFVSKE